MLGATEPRFPNRNYYTNNFRMNVILVMPGFIFYDFRVSLGTLFVTFGVMSCAEVQSEPDSFCNKVNPSSFCKKVNQTAFVTKYPPLLQRPWSSSRSKSVRANPGSQWFWPGTFPGRRGLITCRSHQRTGEVLDQVKFKVEISARIVAWKCC